MVNYKYLKGKSLESKINAGLERLITNGPEPVLTKTDTEAILSLVVCVS